MVLKAHILNCQHKLVSKTQHKQGKWHLITQFEPWTGLSNIVTKSHKSAPDLQCKNVKVSVRKHNGCSICINAKSDKMFYLFTIKLGCMNKNTIVFFLYSWFYGYRVKKKLCRNGILPSCSNWSDYAPDVVITTSPFVNVNFPGGTEQLSVNADTIIICTMQKFSSKILKLFKLGEKLTKCKKAFTNHSGWRSEEKLISLLLCSL